MGGLSEETETTRPFWFSEILPWSKISLVPKLKSRGPNSEGYIAKEIPIRALACSDFKS